MAAIAWLLCAAPAQAGLCGTFLDPMSVSATPLQFGNYLAASAAASTTSITVSCGLLGIDLLPSFSIALSAGGSGTPAARAMTRNSVPLGYNIYDSNLYTHVVGDGSAGSTVYNYNGGLLHLGSTVFTAYGRLPQGQFVPAGTYGDTIVLTVTF
jgi:spore coat protein U-like protein